MLARLSIVAGLVLGVAAAGLLLGGLIALAPEAPASSLPPASAPLVSAAPSLAASSEPSASAGEESIAPGVDATP
ncbi:MAG: hypothetical protein ACJ776_10250 [Chloroflexota bacterium]